MRYIIASIALGLAVLGTFAADMFISTTTCSEVKSSTISDRRAEVDYRTTDKDGHTGIEIARATYYVTLDGTEWEVDEDVYNYAPKSEVSYVIVTDTSLIFRREEQHIEISGDWYSTMQYMQGQMPQGGMQPPMGFDPNMQPGGYGQMPQGGIQPPMGFDPNMQQPNMAQPTTAPTMENESERIDMPIPSAREAVDE